MTEEEIKLMDEFAINAMNYLLKQYKVTNLNNFNDDEIALKAYNFAYEMVELRKEVLK